MRRGYRVIVSRGLCHDIRLDCGAAEEMIIDLLNFVLLFVIIMLLLVAMQERRR